MGQEITVVQQVRQTLDKMRPELVSVLPAHLPVEAFVRITQTALQQNPDLQTCTPRSIIAAATKAAEAGLQPDGEEGAMVAYNVKIKYRDEDGRERERWEKQAKFLPMVRGIRNQVQRSGMVKDWKVRIVYSQDKFRHIDGDVEVLEHEPAYVEGDYPVMVYSIAYLENGEISRHVMRMDTVNKIRMRSRSKDGGPWVSDTEEMVKKTCLKQHSKALPKAKEDLARQRIETTLRALDDAEGVVDQGRLESYEAPRLTSHEAATQKLREAVEVSAFDEPADDRFAGTAPAQPAQEAPKQPRKRKTANERLAEAEAGRTGNGRPAPTAAAQQTAAPLSSTPAPAGRSDSPAAPAASPSDAVAYQDDGRDYDFEQQAALADQYADADVDYQPDEPAEPQGFRGQSVPGPADERPEPAAFRLGWNQRFDGKPRVPPRDKITSGVQAAAFMKGYDAAQRSVDIGNTPGTPQASYIMCSNMISKLYP